MRRFALTIGLLLIAAGFYVVTQGAQVLTPVAEVAGLVSHSVLVTPIVSSTLLSIPPSNYTYVTAELREGVQTMGALQVEGGSEIGFYLMDAGNFSEWRHGFPSMIALAKPDGIKYNFTFVPSGSGLYYFVFSNQDPIRKNVVFTMSTQEIVIVPSPLVQYGGYEILLIGVLLSLIAIKTGKKSASSKIPRDEAPKCRFCGKPLTSGEAFCSKCGRSQS